jgi:hypothetical protein
VSGAASLLSTFADISEWSEKMLMKKSLNAFLKADTLIIVVNAAIKITIKIQATRLLAVLIIW